MIIAILSDVHDNIWKLAELLQDVGRTSASALIFCGDMCAPFTLKQIGDEFDGPVHIVKGNNDGDMMFMSKVADSLDNVTLHNLPFTYLTFDGRRIAVNHYPEIARDQALSGQYDMVCHGHDHVANVERVGHTLLVNPGEVMGRFGKSTYALYDTEAGEAVLREV